MNRAVSRSGSSYIVVASLLILSTVLFPRVLGSKPLVPSEVVQVKLSEHWYPGSSSTGGCYFRVRFTGFNPNDYVLQTDPTKYLGWCVDLDHTINLGTWYNAKLYILNTGQWSKINWIINNKQGHDQYFIQAAIWRVLGEPWEHIGPWLPDPEPDHQSVDDYVSSIPANGLQPVPCQMIAVEIDVQEPVGTPTKQMIFFEIHIPREDVPEFGESIPVVASAVGALCLTIRQRRDRNGK